MYICHGRKAAVCNMKKQTNTAKSALSPPLEHSSLLHLDSVTMPFPQLPLELLLRIAHHITDVHGELSSADFNTFLQVNRSLYSCLNPFGEQPRSALSPPRGCSRTLSAATTWRVSNIFWS
jgi:hypothetical protein